MPENKLRSIGTIFLVIDFLIIWYTKINEVIKKNIFIIINFKLKLFTSLQAVPSSFADLAEKIVPSVVNISTTQTVKTSSINSFSVPTRIPI